MQPVRQLHNDHANIGRHGEQHLAQALRLPVVAIPEADLAQLGDAIHASRHVFAELLAQLFEFGAGVFEHIVQQTRLDAHQVHLHIRQNVRHRQRMHDVRLARFPRLRFVPLGRITARLFEPRQIFLRAQRAQLLFEASIQLLYLGKFQDTS